VCGSMCVGMCVFVFVCMCVCVCVLCWRACVSVCNVDYSSVFHTTHVWIDVGSGIN